MNVLCVDDDPTIQYILHDIFLKSGHETCFASNGIEGLSYLYTSDNVFNLVILDIEMPIMDGFEFISEISNCESFKNLRILIHSSHSESYLSQLFVQKCISKHLVSGFLPKPASFSDISRFIDMIFASAL